MRFLKSPAFIDGLKAMAEPAVAVIAWSIVTNIALLSSGLNSFETLCFNLLVYAGAAQLAVMPLIAGDFPLWTIWFTAFVVNLRFVIFSAAIQPHFKRYSLWSRTGIGYLNGDIPFAKFLGRYPAPDTGSRSDSQLLYFLGMALINWTVWQAGALVAIVFGSYIPAQWGIGFAGTLALVALIVPAIKDKTALISALAAALTCAVTINLPYRLTIVCSVFAGVFAALLMDRTIRKERS